ncbi:glycosyltransferase family 61 protein [Frigoriflavimonas asaccharolytica]|uniref:Capsular polysaccharide biosynthesis protein n=1 Tax=Frigoriflavimonas asaccharolytica TaxID=2735899 RepID=A0A8J8GB25_9FLAO|nr:glycosyltransferase family 61 protein [Frigoriflavimonas asaccharolytica]NRS92680.1 capsular polysaccharide biosynthesis protein [Frigoriflavimonas asaccharolytica]
MLISIKKFVKRQIIKRINVQKHLNNYTISTIQIAILNFLQYQHKSVYKVTGLKKLNPIKKIVSGYKYISKSQNNVEVTIPDLNLYEIKNAIINSRSSAIIQGKNIYYEAINDNERFNEGFVEFHNNKNAVVNLKRTETIEEGFFLAGNGSHNWYHWMIEIIPKIMYLNVNDTKTILVNESCEKTQSMADSLQILTRNLNLNIIYLKEENTYKIKKLYFVNEVNKLMFNPLDSKTTSLPLYYFRKESLQKLSSELQKGFNYKNTNEVNIFLERKNTHRIAQNESEIIETLKLANFRNIDMTSLSFEEQINHFQNAKMIVGTTGAAWTNIIFCKPKTKIIIFMPDNYKDYNFYEEMGEILNIEVQYLYYNNEYKDHDVSEFVINIESLKNLLST